MGTENSSLVAKDQEAMEEARTRHVRPSLNFKILHPEELKEITQGKMKNTIVATMLQATISQPICFSSVICQNTGSWPLPSLSLPSLSSPKNPKSSPPTHPRVHLTKNSLQGHLGLMTEEQNPQ